MSKVEVDEDARELEKSRLNFRQRMFVSYYLGVSQGNGMDAARRAGYGDPGPTSCRMLKMPKVVAAVEARLNEVALSSDEILARLSEQAAVSMDDFVEVEQASDGSEYAIVDIVAAKKRGSLRFIKELSQDENGRWKVKLLDSQKSLELLMKYRGLGMNCGSEEKTYADAKVEEDDDGPDVEPRKSVQAANAAKARAVAAANRAQRQAAAAAAAQKADEQAAAVQQAAHEALSRIEQAIAGQPPDEPLGECVGPVS